MLDLLENVLHRGLDMGGTDSAWYSNRPKRTDTPMVGIQRTVKRAPIIRAEVELAIALHYFGNTRKVARWMHRDESALIKAVKRHQSRLHSN